MSSIGNPQLRRMFSNAEHSMAIAKTFVVMAVEAFAAENRSETYAV